MSDNVHPFKRPARSMEDRAAELDLARRRRLVETENALRERKIRSRLTPTERVAAAKIIRRFVEMAQQEGVTKSDIRARFTKLYDYLGPADDLAEGQADRRAIGATLPSMAIKYLKIAEIVAALTKLKAWELKAEVVESTALWSSSPAGEDGPDERAVALTDMVTEAVDRVAKRLNLQAFFKEAYRTPGAWDIAEGKFKQSSDACLFPLPPSWFEYCGDALALPTVPVMSIVLDQFDVDFVEGPGSPGGHGILQISREVHLGVAPSGASGQPVAIIQTRGGVSLHRTDRIHPPRKLNIAPPWCWSPFDCFIPSLGDPPLPIRTVRVSTDTGLVRMHFVLRSDNNLEERTDRAEVLPWPDIFETGGIESHYFTYNRVDPRILDYIFSWPVSTRDEKGYRTDQVTVYSDIAYAGSIKDPWYPSSLAGYYLEAMLRSGSLEAEMEKSISNMISVFHTYKEEWRAAAERRTNNFILYGPMPEDEEEGNIQ